MTDPMDLARDAAEWLMYLGDLRSKADLELVADAIYSTVVGPLVRAQEQELALARAGALAEISEVAAKAVGR